MRVILFSLILVFAFVCVAASEIDYVIEPGVSIGPITADTTEKDLIRIYGSTNVLNTSINSGEIVSKGTIIFPDDSKRKLTIFWKNNEPNRNPRSISIKGGKSMWVTRDGIALGTSLRDIVRLNGRPSELINRGDSWDFYGLYINDVRGGKLKELVGKGLFVKLEPWWTWPWMDRPPFWESRNDDGTILSNHPQVERMNYSIQYMSINFDKFE